MSVKLIGLKEFNKRSDNAKKYAVQIQHAPAPMVIRDVALRQSVALAREKYKYPSKPKYPLRWKSDKQRKYVMARLRKEDNLPYRRTNNMAETWDYSRKGQYQATIYNEAKDPLTGRFIAPFLIGAWQQPFHADTGWQKRSTSIEKAIVKPVFEDIKKRSIALLKASQNA